MKEVIILRGLPFSGKTTWAEKFKQRREDSISFDVQEVFEQLNTTRTKSECWQIVEGMLMNALKKNDIIVIDDINILSSSITRILDVLHSFKLIHRETIVVRMQEMHTPYDLCVKRAEAANASEHLLKRMKHYYNHCLRRQIIYRDEENS
jgi:predicted kinase